MKNRKIEKTIIRASVLHLLILLFLLGSISACSKLESEQGKETIKKGIQAPVFSKKSGFYNGEVLLRIEAEEGSKIYYTLDSTTPTTKSSEYQGEITLKDPSEEANRYAYNPDFYPYQTEPVIAGEPEVAPGYYARHESLKKPVDKCVVVRAIALDAEGNCSSVNTASYFIDYDKKSGYTGISVLSVVTDPDGLFGDDNGIMVNGTTYKKALASGKLDGINSTFTLRNYTNSFTGRGKDWERPVHVDYFEEGGQEISFSQEAGIRLHGNQSRVVSEQKSFNLYARKEYDGNKIFLSPFFGDGVLSDRITLMRGEDVSNYYFCSQVDSPDAHTQKYTMTQLFIDGEYWGLYAIQERYHSDEYMKARYGFDEGEYSLFSGKSYGFDYKEGDKNATKTSFRQLREYVKNHDMSDDKEYKKVQSMMDMDSFIKTYALRIYIGDQDWNWHKNMFIMLYDNKWYWLPYDLDFAAGKFESSKVYVDTFTSQRLIKTESLENDVFFPYLMKNKDFCNQFISTFMDFPNETFRKDYVKKDKEEYLNNYKDAIAKSCERYPDQERYWKYSGVSCYEQMWNRDYEYLAKRPDYAIPYLKSYFGIENPLVKLTIEVNDPDGGNVRLNSIYPALGEKGSWSGSYFANIPVKLHAKAKDGWKFVGWQCKNGNFSAKDQADTDFSFKGNVTVTAIFENETKNK